MTDGLTDKDRSGIRAALEANPKVRRAVLFGSRAMGTFRGASDVDIALEGEDIRLQDLVAIKAQIGKLNLPVEVDPVIRAKIDNPDLEKHLQNIEKKVKESDQIINNLLFYSRIKKSNYEAVNFVDTINDSIENSLKKYFICL